MRDRQLTLWASKPYAERHGSLRLNTPGLNFPGRGTPDLNKVVVNGVRLFPDEKFNSKQKIFGDTSVWFHLPSAVQYPKCVKLFEWLVAYDAKELEVDEEE